MLPVDKPKWTGNVVNSQPCIKTAGNYGIMRVRSIFIFMEEHINQLPNTKLLAYKAYIQETLYRLNSLYLGMYLYLGTQTCTNTYINTHIFVQALKLISEKESMNWTEIKEGCTRVFFKKLKK